MLHARIRPAAWLPAMLAVLGATPGPALAQTIDEKAQACAGCHGENGVPQQKTMPVIWGQQQGYLYLQLRDFKSGARKNDIMGPIAQALERDDMMALAAYFSQKPWPNLQQPMIDFRNRSRANNPGMSDLMLSISEDDIAACAAYLAGL